MLTFNLKILAQHWRLTLNKQQKNIYLQYFSPQKTNPLNIVTLGVLFIEQLFFNHQVILYYIYIVIYIYIIFFLSFVVFCPNMWKDEGRGLILQSEEARLWQDHS